MRAALILAAALSLGLAAAAQDVRPALEVRPLSRPPVLEDFLDMQPPSGLAAELARVTGFIQRDPNDGQPASQRTEVYLGYDDRNLYLVWLCFDERPERIRARLSRRDQIGSDDQVEVMLDTFHDRRRAFVFAANPLGVQFDGLYTEGQGTDGSFDTVWHARAARTSAGYAVWMAIPFRSLRFSSQNPQSWGIVLQRFIPHASETSYWPHVSRRIEGRLNQAGRLEGFTGISPGRNLQFIPYGVFRSFRALDLRDPAAPAFAHQRGEFDGGLDAKLVLKDRMILDFALNPDFSQVESDAPQVTVNQRFEVFFPEKRPFFLENAGYFSTPINLLFTRRIADPQFGARMTGKAGPWALGFLYADDQSPGRRVLPSHPLAGTRAHFGVARVTRDFAAQSTVGFIFTAREHEGSSNRVGGADTRLKLSDTWVFRGQAITSATRFLDGSRIAGPAYDARLTHNSRHLSTSTQYRDVSPGFFTSAGFVNRTDIRRLQQTVNYRVRPRTPRVLSWGPFLAAASTWDHHGLRLDQQASAELNAEFSSQTFLGAGHARYRERLRPQDFFPLPGNRDFPTHDSWVFLNNETLRQVSLVAYVNWGRAVNFVPPAGEEPAVASALRADLSLSLRPVTALRIDNTYTHSSLRREAGPSIFNNHIVRSRWNWQLSRALSVRVIGEYNALLASPGGTLLPTTRRFNADFLVTYLPQPGTAVYVGYNSNLQNLHPGLALDPATGGIQRTPAGFINDGRQVFVKVSYLLRF